MGVDEKGRRRTIGDRVRILGGDSYDIFARNSSDLGKSDLLEYEIHTGDCQPIKQLPRRVPPYQQEVT